MVEGSDAGNGSDEPTERLGGPEQSRSRRALIAGAVGLVVLVVVLGGIGLSFAGDDEPESAVAVVTVEGPITADLATNLETELRELRTDTDVEAIVLEMDTPGGLVQPSERMYTAVDQASEDVPVVASVQGLSASGGYWAMLPAEQVYVLGSSIVGSVGVNANAPEPSGPTEGPTGPDKAGSTTTTIWSDIDTVQRLFVESVFEERGDRIELSREAVETATVWRGVAAVENGMADEIGTLDAAIQDAADRAGLEEFRVLTRDVTPSGGFLLLGSEGELLEVTDGQPSLDDVNPVEMSVVYEPQVPRIETVESVVGEDVTAITENDTEEEDQ